MAAKPVTRPRKIATQERSRATVDNLIEATARILVKDGFDKASTNRIAEVSGVSIGSLYQYFPSKEALVAAVIERHQQQIMQTVRSELTQVSTQPLDLAMRRFVAVAVQAHRLDPPLHRVLAEPIPRVGKLEKLETFSRKNSACSGPISKEPGTTSVSMPRDRLSEGLARKPSPWGSRGSPKAR